MDSDDPRALTAAGWPRPVFDGWPVPWVSPQGRLSKMDDGRLAACAAGAVCAVCGHGYGVVDDPDDPGETIGEKAYALARAVPDDTGPDSAVRAMDNAVMHERCLRLALARCPALLKLTREGVLLVLRVWSGSGVVHVNPDDTFDVWGAFDIAEVVGPPSAVLDR